eukprot:145400-Pelagomonas_calceolata.AAC.1
MMLLFQSFTVHMLSRLKAKGLTAFLLLGQHCQAAYPSCTRIFLWRWPDGKSFLQGVITCKHQFATNVISTSSVEWIYSHIGMPARKQSSFPIKVLSMPCIYLRHCGSVGTETIVDPWAHCVATTLPDMRRKVAKNPGNGKKYFWGSVLCNWGSWGSACDAGTQLKMLNIK